MDAFYKVSRHRRKRRVHFHEFMREIHARMRALSGTEDPLDAISTRIAQELRLLCFDEFHVSDIADAMILARLLELMIAKGVVFVMTSNYEPDRLYPNGLQRARFLPAIEILKRELDVIALGGGTDHRRRILEGFRVWYSPPGEEADQHLAQFFEAVTKAAFERDGTIEVGGRPLAFRQRAKGVLWIDFEALCREPRSQLDYLEIASGYHTVLVSGVPKLAPEATDVVRRLTWLVDVFYDQRVRLVMSAEVPPENLVGDRCRSHGAGKDGPCRVRAHGEPASGDAVQGLFRAQARLGGESAGAARAVTRGADPGLPGAPRLDRRRHRYDVQGPIPHARRGPVRSPRGTARRFRACPRAT